MKRFMLTCLFPLMIMLFLLTGCAANADTTDESVTLTISAAASLTDALEDIKQIYEKEHEIRLTYNFSGSGTLAQQIQQGAPVDLFISANEQWMDTLESNEQIISSTRKNLAGNRLVLIAHLDAAQTYTSISEILTDDSQSIAIGNPDSVPAGAYTREALTSLHLWEDVQDQVILAKNVRQVLTYIETGNADLGFVYESDARLADNVQVVAIADEGIHDPISYPAAVINGSDHVKQAEDFLHFLMSDRAQAILTEHGFNQ